MKAKKVDWKVLGVVGSRLYHTQIIDPPEMFDAIPELRKKVYADTTHLVFAGSELYNLMPSEIKYCDLYKTRREYES